MAVLNAGMPTLHDIAQRSIKNGQLDGNLVELLSEQNDILEDIPLKESNYDQGSYKAVIRTGLPESVFRNFNQYVPVSKGTAASVVFNPAMVASRMAIDVDLANLNGNASVYRYQEAMAHMESMGQRMANTLLNGSEKDDPSAFTGLTQYYNKFSTTPGTPGFENLIDGKKAFSSTPAKATDHLGSVWLIGWGDGCISGFTPKGLPSGFQNQNFGIVPVTNASGAFMDQYINSFKWTLGLAIEDWRYAVRIANINTTRSELPDFIDARPAFETLPELMHSAMARMPTSKKAKQPKKCWYMSRPMKAKLESIISRMTAESSLGYEEVGGVMIQTFKGIPLRVNDAQAVDESLVT